MSEGLFGTAHNFATYGVQDDTAIKQKRFIDEITSSYGAHSSELRKYYDSSKNWRNLLVPASKAERKDIIFNFLQLDILKETEAKDLDEAFDRLDKMLTSVSRRVLEDFFENNIVVHNAIGAMAKHTKSDNYGLTITVLAGDILNWETKMLKKEKCPQRFWKTSRLQLIEVPCEFTKSDGTGDHRKDCKQYEKDGTVEWHDFGSRVGVGRKKYFADLQRMRDLKMKAIRIFISKILAEHDYEYMKERLVRINWEHPAVYTQPDLVALFEFDEDEKSFINEYFNIYDVQVQDNGDVITRMKDVMEE